MQNREYKGFWVSRIYYLFDTQGEFVKNIWIDISLIVSVSQFGIIEAALYASGEEFELCLIDWNGPKLFDLADKSQIEKYLVGNWR